MAYPNPPNFQSADPGSAWWVIQAADGPHVVISQWDTIVRVFQANAKRMLEAAGIPLYGRSASGECPATGSSISRDISDTFSVWFGSTNVRRTSEITVDGQFGPETADLLWFLLCSTRQTQRATEWASAITQRVIPLEMVRQMIWFGFYVQTIRNMYTEELPSGTRLYTASIEGTALTIPNNAVAPLWNQTTQSAAPDRLFFGEFRPGIDPLPVAPSQGTGTPPAAEPARIPLSITIGVALGAGALTWWLTSPRHDGHRELAYGAG